MDIFEEQNISIWIIRELLKAQITRNRYLRIRNGETGK
jgi:hypothetical protein